MTDVERRDLLEVLEDRYGKRSTVLTSQLPTKKLAARRAAHDVDRTQATAVQ
jgi:hypothetical protein